MKTLLALAVLTLLSGCTQLPDVSAKRIHYQSSYPIGGTTIDMEGVTVTDAEVKADKYVRKSRWWYIAQDVEIDGYSRQRSAK